MLLLRFFSDRRFNKLSARGNLLFLWGQLCQESVRRKAVLNSVPVV